MSSIKKGSSKKITPNLALVPFSHFLRVFVFRGHSNQDLNGFHFFRHQCRCLRPHQFDLTKRILCMWYVDRMQSINE